MRVKHSLAEAEDSPRERKRSSPTLSSDIPELSSDTSSPYFSAAATSPTIMPDPLPSYPPLDPASLSMSSSDDNNYTTSAMATAPTTFGEMEKMAMESDPVEEHITSVTPVKSTAQKTLEADMLQVTPTTGSPTSTTCSDHIRSKTEEFSRMSIHDRRKVFRTEYPNDDIELQRFCVPDECYLYPDFGEEILEAYLFKTCFNVKVWVNYDSIDKQLYAHEQRLQSCGVLDLTLRQRKVLRRLGPEVCQFKKLRLDVGTPFRTLFEVYIDVANDTPSKWKLDVNYQEVPEQNSPHQILEHAVKAACSNIQEDGIPYSDQIGLTYEDLKAIALEFRVKPKNGGEYAQWFTKR